MPDRARAVDLRAERPRAALAHRAHRRCLARVRLRRGSRSRRRAGDGDAPRPDGARAGDAANLRPGALQRRRRPACHADRQSGQRRARRPPRRRLQVEVGPVAYEFKLPDLGEGLTEGEIARWLVSEGQQIAEDDPLVEIATDKTTVEIPSPAAGTVSQILVQEGEVVPVGTVLVVIGVNGAPPPPKTEPPA